ncbi:type 4 pilus major pilin [Xanthomonas perforans]|uniref:type 4 pilus major pilin n=1 Tax=Xanthomonas perforans TaxID=442694 RepID=UPI0023596B57|nr:type 4 pilus major pilin [Xanthomonas perforans]MDC9654336.1 type 4 pilus major pilin [Xanthomonas perforans]MEB2158983.1 type 4 pilus major pilin [Xanthomonas campestris pv. campestris]
MKMLKTGKKQAGLTMLELMGVIIIGAILVVGGMYAFGAGKSDSKTGQEINAISTLLARIPKMESINGYGPAGANLNAAAASRGVFPEGWTVNGATVTNRYGGTVVLTSTGLGVTSTSTGYSSQVCQDVAQRTSGLRNVAVTVGSTANNGPIDASAAATQCAGASNTITWTMN